MKRFMKFAGITLLSAAMAFGVMGCEKETADSEVVIYERGELLSEPIVLSNEYLELSFNTETTAFDIKDKRTGVVWHSSAENTASDAIATTNIKKMLDSALYLQYVTKTGDTKYLSSTQFSVEKEYYNWEVIGDSIKVNYTVGDIDRKYIVPPAMGVEEP